MKAMTDATSVEFSNALSLLRTVAASENGNIFISSTGNFVFHDRHHRFKPPYDTPQAYFNNIPVLAGEMAYIDARLRNRKQDIANLVTVSVDGGITYSAEDLTSKAAYRRRTQSISSIVSNPNDAQSLAQFLVGAYKDAITTWDYIVLEPQMDDPIWFQVMGREVGDRIYISATPPGPAGTTYIQKQAVIEKIEHKMVDNRWTTTWRLGRADLGGFWVLGVSQLGTGTKLAY